MTVAENYVNFAPPFFFYQLPIMTVLLSAEERRESINRKFWQVGKKMHNKETAQRALMCESTQGTHYSIPFYLPPSLMRHHLFW